MNIRTATVQRSGRAADSRPRIQFMGNWLTETGFVNGALVQALPEPGGLVFKLFNENIASYSDLYCSTKERGGSLGRIYISDTKSVKGPVFVTTGKHISRAGLRFGDSLAVKYEYGLIRARRLEKNVRLINVSKARDHKTGVFRPWAFIWGDWLNDIGFTPDTLMTVASEPGCITFTAQRAPIIYSEIVRHARKNKMQLLQVSYKTGQLTNATVISMRGSRLERAGFGMDDIFYVTYEYGVIKLQKLDPALISF